MPDISLIMVSHDKPRYAREALQSVLGQTHRDWEAVPVDYLQFCHTAAVLKAFATAYGTTQYHSEKSQDAKHADGIFMEQIGALTTVHNIDTVLSLNRKTPESVSSRRPRSGREKLEGLFAGGLRTFRAWRLR